MKVFVYILTTVLILVIGCVCNAIYVTLNPGDGWTFYVNLFCYTCALPALLLPYYVFLARNMPLRCKGMLSAVLAGFAFPIAVGSFTLIGYSLGLEMTWDKLVESPAGWLILIFITVGPGVLLAYLSVKGEKVLGDIGDRMRRSKSEG